MRAEDEGAGRGSTLAEAARMHFGVDDLRAVARGFYVGEIDRPKLAAFAAPVLRLAEQGERLAAAASAGAARALAELAGTCAQRLSLTAPNVALTGGTLANLDFREAVAAAVRVRLPGAEVIAPRYDPAAGALLLAYKEAGAEPPATLETTAA
jgi:N-acetylglucosamine kinase